jgi:hypothetical protein
MKLKHLAAAVLVSPFLVSTLEPANAFTVPKVDPWHLQKPVLFHNAKVSYYYKGVVLAGETAMVKTFLDTYGLTVKYRPNATSKRVIWAACNEVVPPQQTYDGQTVCVAVDGKARAADNRIYFRSYADRVARKVLTHN